jgi:hypothetical protein
MRRTAADAADAADAAAAAATAARAITLHVARQLRRMQGRQIMPLVLARYATS